MFAIVGLQGVTVVSPVKMNALREITTVTRMRHAKNSLKDLAVVARKVLTGVDQAVKTTTSVSLVPTIVLLMRFARIPKEDSIVPISRAIPAMGLFACQLWDLGTRGQVWVIIASLVSIV